MSLLADSTQSQGLGYDVEKNDLDNNYKLSEDTPTYIRHAFIRKVLGLVSLQLTVTVAFCLVTIFVKPLKEFFLLYGIYFLVVVVAYFIFISVISIFYPKALRSSPWCYLIFCTTTLFASLLCSVLCSYYQTYAILISVSVTLGIMVLLTAFTLQTKIDFTHYLIFFFISALILAIFGIVAIFLPYGDIGYYVINALSTLLICFYICGDIQLIVGGKTYEWTVDDFIPASNAIYMDIVSLFAAIIGNFR